MDSRTTLADEKQIEFDADFESANLERVIAKEENVYDVFLRSDSNSTANL